MEYDAGRAGRHLSRARTYNFDVVWTMDRAEQQGVKFAAYYDDVAKEPGDGAWAYLKKKEAWRIRPRDEGDEGDQAGPRRRLNPNFDDLNFDDEAGFEGPNS